MLIGIKEDDLVWMRQAVDNRRARAQHQADVAKTELDKIDRLLDAVRSGQAVSGMET